MTRLEEWWIDFCREAYMKKPEGYIQIRKLHSFQALVIPGDVWLEGIDLKFSDMGYQNDTSKMKQLVRNYFNEEEIQKANAKFSERFYSSSNKSNQSCISCRMGAKAKRDESQGFCIQTITLNHCGDNLYVDLSYRTTEITQKFLADLKFLHEKVIPALTDGIDMPITAVRFHFSTTYVSLMFLPILYQFVDILGFLEELQERDPKYAKQVINGMHRFMQEENTYNYRSRALMHDFFRNRVYKNLFKKEIREIEKFVKSIRGEK